MIIFDDVTKQFPDGTRAVDGFNLTLPAHKTTVFVGSSGCGKTTLLRMINRMVEPSSGVVSIPALPASAAVTGRPPACSCRATCRVFSAWLVAC